MAERKQTNKQANEKKAKKQPKVEVRDLKPAKDAKGGEPPDTWKPPFIP
jgi:hypothetical protein